jgi:hypothetical protein
MNESILRSPKWLRNIADFEINTGDDIKGEPSIKKQKKLDAERLRKEEEYARLKEEEIKRIEKQRLLKEEEDRVKGKEFDELFSVISKYILDNYKSCKISIPENNMLIISEDYLTYKGSTFEFKLTLDNTISHPTFRCYAKWGKKEYDYNVKGTLYMTLKNFILGVVYPWYSSNRSKQNYNNDYSDNSGSSKNSDSDEIKNKRRRYGLLKDTLKSFEKDMRELLDWEYKNAGKTHPNKEVIKNQIESTKDKIKGMKDKYKFEKLNHLYHFEKFNS